MSLKNLLSRFALTVKATVDPNPSEWGINQMTTAVESGGRLVLFTEAERVVYARQIETFARPRMVYAQFAVRQNDLSATPGRTIEFLKMHAIKRGGALVEGTPIKETTLAGSTRQITVREYGNAIGLSELRLRTAFFDLMRESLAQLAFDYAMVLNSEIRDVMETAPNVLYAYKHGTGGALTPNTSRTDLDGTSSFDIALVNDALEYMRINMVPPYSGINDYVCILTPHQERQLRDEIRDRFVRVTEYRQPGEQFFGEIGKIDNVIFVVSIMNPSGSIAPDHIGGGFREYLKAGWAGDGTNPAVSANVDIAFMFGAQFVAWAVAMPVEVRQNGIIDYQREHGIGWYAIWGTALLNEEHGIRLESASPAPTAPANP